MLKLLNYMPMMIIVVLIYFLTTALTQGGITVEDQEAGIFSVWDRMVFAITLPSGAIWNIDWGTILLSVGLIALYIEVSLSARSSAGQIVNHVFSMLIFVASLILFFIMPQAGTSIFFLLIMMMFVDVVAGFTISIRSARRDFGHTDHLA